MALVEVSRTLPNTVININRIFTDGAGEHVDIASEPIAFFLRRLHLINPYNPIYLTAPGNKQLIASVYGI